ncbi:MAG: hypothetical protein AABY73_00800 [Pseudomonadota bacterium]
MHIDLETAITLFGIVTGSVIAIVGLFQNAAAMKRHNRISISTKLVEASKLLNDELVSRCRSYQLYLNELAEAEKHPGSEVKTKKIAGLQSLIEGSLARQKELDQHIAEVQGMFANLDKIDPGRLDASIALSYQHQTLATSSLDLVKEIKSNNA